MSNLFRGHLLGLQHRAYRILLTACDIEGASDFELMTNPAFHRERGSIQIRTQL